jgi:hypothetical protein
LVVPSAVEMAALWVGPWVAYLAVPWVGTWVPYLAVQRGDWSV